MQKKKKKKKSSENDQLTGHFQSFFIYFFRPPHPLNLKKNSRKSTIKKILALWSSYCHLDCGGDGCWWMFSLITQLLLQCALFIALGLGPIEWAMLWVNCVINP